MRITRIVLVIAFAAFAAGSWAKYDAGARPKLSFAERWAPVDDALHSGGFRQQ